MAGRGSDEPPSDHGDVVDKAKHVEVSGKTGEGGLIRPVRGNCSGDKHHQGKRTGKKENYA